MCISYASGSHYGYLSYPTRKPGVMFAYEVTNDIEMTRLLDPSQEPPRVPNTTVAEPPHASSAPVASVNSEEPSHVPNITVAEPPRAPAPRALASDLNLVGGGSKEQDFHSLRNSPNPCQTPVDPR